MTCYLSVPKSCCAYQHVFFSYLSISLAYIQSLCSVIGDSCIMYFFLPQSAWMDASGPTASASASARTAAGVTDGRDAAAAPAAGRGNTATNVSVRATLFFVCPLLVWCDFHLPRAACEPGTFGLGCEGRCQCARGVSCHHATGDCQCPPGWRGKLCDKGTPKKDVVYFLVLNDDENIFVLIKNE